MNGYLSSVIGVALCVGLLEELLPGESQSRAYIRLLTALCILAVMIAPLGRFLSSLPSLFEELELREEVVVGDPYGEIVKGTVEEAVREGLVAAVKQELAARFSVNSERAEVGILFHEGGEAIPSRIIITLYGKDIFKDPYKIEEYFGDMIGCECLVVIG